MPQESRRAGVKRECYTLCGFESQTKESRRVRGSDAAKLTRIIPAGGGHPRERVGNPCRLVAFAPERNGGEIWRVGLHEQLPPRHQAQQIFVSPLLERDDSAEGHAPASVDCELGQLVRTGVAMQNTSHARGPGLVNERSCIIFGVAGVNDERPLQLTGESYLGGKRRALRVSRRIVVMIVEPALPYGDCAAFKELAKPRNVALLIESGRILRMDASGREHKTGILGRVFGSECRGVQRLPNTDDSRRARIAGAGYYRVAVTGERRVREVGVAVDEDRRASVLRGHLRSIQRSTGAAT